MTEAVVHVRVTLRPEFAAYAKRHGYPTEPFTGIRAGRAPYKFWSSVIADGSDQVIPLPPMFLVCDVTDADATA